MGSRTYTADVAVLRKTKLGESDLILTCLAADGSQVRFVAKGARKPGNSFSSRLELYSFAHVLLVERSGLDIAKEVRLLDGHDALRRDLERSMAAAPMAEILERVSQDGLEVPRLFELSSVAFSCLESCPAELAHAVCAAHLLKVLAFVGVAPSLTRCSVCGDGVDVNVPTVRFGIEEGGVVCGHCRAHAATVEMPGLQVRWIDALLHVRFADMARIGIGERAADDALRFCQNWVRVHLGCNLKSLGYLLRIALPDEAPEALSCP